MKTLHARRFTRREFLITAGAALAGAALGCGQSQGRATIPATVAPTLAPIVPTAPPEQAADLALVNGKIITVDGADTIAQAVAVKGGLIQAVGTNDVVAGLIGEATRVVDLAGRAVTPGLIDPHNHFQVFGLMNTYYTPFVPPEVRTMDDLRAKLTEVAAQTPEGEWIKGYYLSFQEGRMPTRHDLDPASPNHPVWIMQQGGHYGSANSRALEIAGITAATPNPEGGIIGRDANGEPDGIFYNHRAMDLLRRHIPLYTQEMVWDNIVSTQAFFAACGLTTFHDNNVRGVDTIRTYLNTGRQGALFLRGAIYYTLEWPSDLERALNEVEHYEDEFMRMAGFKFLIDGQAAMAYCHEPHNGVSWTTTTWDPQEFKNAVRALHDAGLQICVHCIGDAAVDLTLDAYEEAMNANPRPDPRHRIEHAVLTTPQATQRIKDLGVVISTQPQFIRMGGDYWATIFTPAQMARVIVTREWLEAGIHLALGSDAPTTPWYTPQVTLAGAVSRLTASNQALSPDQCLTIQEALRAHTIEAAYAGHEENIKGSIEVGKLADMAVWAEDPYSASLQRLWQIPVDMTLVGGEVVYQRGEG
jgi:predicted amidohydrolase YtcJ